jgi:hypothetical protein
MDLKLDQWATTPPAGYPGTVSPPPAKRIAGWANGEEPPAGYFNHAWDALSDTQNELANLISGAGLTRSESNLTQVLAAIQALIGRAQLKTALTTVRMIHDTGVGPQSLNALARARVSPAGYSGQAIAVGTAGTIQCNQGPRSNFNAQAPQFAYTGDFTDIAYDATLGLFIAVGKTGEIQTSTGDGTWIRRANGGANFLKIATNGLGLCVAVGALGLIKYSTNGTSWSTATDPFAGTPDIDGIAYGAGLFVIGTGEGDIASSPDGITWTARRSYGGATGRGPVIYDPSLGFLYEYTSNGEAFRSADGITWTRIHNALFGGNDYLVASPYGWLIHTWSTDGTTVDVRYSPTAINQPPDFTIDYVTIDQLKWMRFIDGQLWALGGSKIYLGGVL